MPHVCLPSLIHSISSLLLITSTSLCVSLWVLTSRASVIQSFILTEYWQRKEGECEATSSPWLSKSSTITMLCLHSFTQSWEALIMISLVDECVFLRDNVLSSRLLWKELRWFLKPRSCLSLSLSLHFMSLIRLICRQKCDKISKSKSMTSTSLVCQLCLYSDLSDVVRNHHLHPPSYPSIVFINSIT